VKKKKKKIPGLYLKGGGKLKKISERGKNLLEKTKLGG